MQLEVAEFAILAKIKGLNSKVTTFGGYHFYKIVKISIVPNFMKVNLQFFIFKDCV